MLQRFLKRFGLLMPVVHQQLLRQVIAGLKCCRRVKGVNRLLDRLSEGRIDSVQLPPPEEFLLISEPVPVPPCYVLRPHFLKERSIEAAACESILDFWLLALWSIRSSGGSFHSPSI